MLQGRFRATDFHDRTEKEKRQGLGARVEEVKKRRRRALKKGLPTDRHEADLKSLRNQLRELERER